MIVEKRLVRRHLEATMLGVGKVKALRPLVGATLPVPLPLRSEDSAPREGALTGVLARIVDTSAR